jgi:uncharacterized protein with von Willebrand factor type A (vWA) domain
VDERILQFIRALRATGVRVSVAESADALRAVEQVGVMDRETFKAALRTALVKDARSLPIFEELFPLFFGLGEPPMMPATGGLSPRDQRLLQQALQALARLFGPQMAELLRRLLEGQPFTPEELQALARYAGSRHIREWADRQALARWMQRGAGLDERLEEMLRALLRMLAEAGMDANTLRQLEERMRANRAALVRQIQQAAGMSALERLAERPPEPSEAELLERPFHALTPTDLHRMRQMVARLAARLRTRAALRMKRGDGRRLDAKATLRANLRHAGVPFDLRFRRRHLKPRLVVLCDLSTSVRHCSEFFLHLIYLLQDQISRTRSFVFIDDLREITPIFAEERPEEAVRRVLRENPPGYYNTDLGTSLATFCRSHLDALDRKTTVIIVGDGRNNYNDPRLDCFEVIRRRAKRILWFNPEPRALWGTGDSDMLLYAPLCAAVHQVQNLAELTEAIDRLFERGGA